MSQYDKCALHLSGAYRTHMCSIICKMRKSIHPQSSRRCNEMPNIKSAKKRVKVNKTKAAANKARKSNLKTMLKKADAAVATGAANKEEAIRVAIKKVDQACAKGLMHKNAAARKKSQLAKKLNAAD